MLSMCHANSPDAIRLASLQYVAAVSSQSDIFCDALADRSRQSTLVKLLTLATSNHPLVSSHDKLWTSISVLLCCSDIFAGDTPLSCEL